ncbi:STAS domain-containing protein [Rubrivivax rivuli]|uniref:STAS domain-containing protein n=1 Tax=Rubrivivax rivuli TaxID=1862385 RepID=A0A437RQS5_9BURK|nr:STAS domain-containing protein [Rubrivivax rivuli]RVU49025.1 STAS domain-containing protein [Rubrivivax rivuli]
MNDTLPTPGAPLRLPAELTIYTVGELHPQWLAWLASSEPVAAVTGESVDQVDAAGLQLLLALQRGLADKGHSLALHAPSTALQAACQALGLQGWLAEHSPGVAA